MLQIVGWFNRRTVGENVNYCPLGEFCKNSFFGGKLLFLQRIMSGEPSFAKKKFFLDQASRCTTIIFGDQIDDMIFFKCWTKNVSLDILRIKLGLFFLNAFSN
jgi:hypothetical protein